MMLVGVIKTLLDFCCIQPNYIINLQQSWPFVDVTFIG
jgi:hypothetical protein